MTRLLFVDNSETIPHYSPFEHWKACFPEDFRCVRAPAGELSGLDPKDYSHVLLSGSESCSLDEKNWMLEEEKFVRAAVAAKIPILGSCFGHQLIAKAMFGREAVRVREKPELGWKRIRVLADDPLWGKKEESQSGFLFHYDEVAFVPSDRAAVVAESDECAVQSFKLHDAPVWGIQSHFEIGVAEGIRLLRHAGYSANEVQKGVPPLDTGFLVPLMDRFLAL
ncbi:MAG: type 1 glutamine amidotransferase [Synergistaceae bacterium]|nr:type 1 glutamine amidotransferase [Synergistaceae bacterium]